VVLVVGLAAPVLAALAERLRQDKAMQAAMTLKALVVVVAVVLVVLAQIQTQAAHAMQVMVALG
jgi:uncharacterized membrane protein YbaN (DUF454 family)